MKHESIIVVYDSCQALADIPAQRAVRWIIGYVLFPPIFNLFKKYSVCFM